MEDIRPNPEKFTLSLSNAAQLTSFAIALGFTFSIIRNYLYYVLCLHIPIFQYLSLSDVILVAPSGIFWTIYFASMDTVNVLNGSSQFSSLEKITYGIFVYSFAGLLTWIGFHNEPIVEQALTIIIKYPWYLVVVIIYVWVRIHAKNANNDFFSKNRYTAAFILCIWYAIFDSYASYNVLTNPHRTIHLIIQTKKGKQINIAKDLIYAGRTKDYWFVYSTKTKYVRVINNDDVATVDFDSKVLLH